MIGEDVAPKSEVPAKKGISGSWCKPGEPTAVSGRIIISPSAKKLAQELGVDITK